MIKSSLAALAIATLTLFTHQANAVQITINEDSATRLDFSLNWSAVGGVTYGDNQQTYIRIGETRWGDQWLETMNVDASFVESSQFFITLDADRVFVGAGRNAGTHTPIPSSYVIGPDGLSGRFIYDNPTPPNGVPDSGGSLLLLSVAGAGLLGFRRLRVCS